MRGDLVTVVMPGEFGGKPRPAVIVQTNLALAHTSVTVLPITGAVLDVPLEFTRLAVDPTPDNGLQKRSAIMVDKAHTVRTERVGQAFGRFDARTMTELNRRLALFFGFAD